MKTLVRRVAFVLVVAVLAAAPGLDAAQSKT
jgi:hypothetical protein